LKTSLNKLLPTCSLLLVILFAGNTVSAQLLELPEISTPVPVTATSHPLLAANHQQVPLDLADYGYVEQEYLLSGEAGVYDWPSGDGTDPLEPLAAGPYQTRILVRRPAAISAASGVVIVEALNPSSPVDLPIMWAESHLQFMADGVTWVGVTVKPNTMIALKRFDPARYASLSMAHPENGPTCAASAINSWSNPTTPDDETGLAWDMLTQLGLLLKSDNADNPAGAPAQRLYMTGQSQTAGYARTYTTVFARAIENALGEPLYDGYLYSGSPPWQVPLHQCMEEFPEGDPRLLTGPAGVPVIELFAQGDIGTNIGVRRQDAESQDDLYRRYEVAGGVHVDPWEGRSSPSDEDMLQAVGGLGAEPICDQVDVEPSDFPNRYLMNAAWRNLDAWVRDGNPAPRSPRLELVPEASAAFDPAASFVVDEHGNALGGVRTPYVDVPMARWIGAKTPSFNCMFYGYKISFDKDRLEALYSSHADYVRQVRESVEDLQAQGWLTRENGAEIIREAELAPVP